MYHGKPTLFTVSAFLALFGGATMWGSPSSRQALRMLRTQHVHPVGMTFTIAWMG